MSLDNGDITISKVNKFFKAVRQFYVKSVDYIVATYPIQDDLLLLQNAIFFNFEKR